MFIGNPNTLNTHCMSIPSKISKIFVKHYFPVIKPCWLFWWFYDFLHFLLLPPWWWIPRFFQWKMANWSNGSFFLSLPYWNRVNIDNSAISHGISAEVGGHLWQQRISTRWAHAFYNCFDQVPLKHVLPSPINSLPFILVAGQICFCKGKLSESSWPGWCPW